MGFRDRLQREIFTDMPDVALTKLTKNISVSAVSAVSGGHENIPPVFVSFVSADSGVSKNIRTLESGPESASTAASATARNWLIHYADRDPLQVVCVPEATHAQIMAWYPEAIAAEPFVGLAAEEPPKPDTFPDDRRTCDQCANLLARRCTAAKRGEIVSSRNYEPIRDLPRRCEGYAPGAADPDGRPGRERWPGLIQKGSE
ncbi:MAG: hypothetical protein J0M01_15260 [Dechloromonas sp.]|mgnify:CR=1 FL=1|jgi:hypothetical protein|nr:hypothetical protein [Dechloromonas sp.]